ncbi:sulfate adenylyltransferase OS=Castellaniella defragrans OX=75697 GN=HNR28_000020 PE=4 SV=1 [Castellaniella denitrificans]|uniref:sulfate adenylyltransferase subunit 1 n=1 Tax=Castellaniella sp. TaxID=1955812 RepID=UPI002AFE8260|nr:GTP-binding protein [Castellaniella sp.]
MNAINEQWQAAQETSVLRLITAGSVDDGKSTLIGRLLVDSKGVFADQLQAIAGSKYTRAPNSELDLALLTDGLEAEREQGITIDVAYRYFATPARKFIVADAPGHEQYTRNMVTGASTADAAVILIDASRASDGRLLPQTKRHSTLARLLGLRHIVVAVNKMDLVDWDRAVFERIHTAYRDLAGRLDIPAFHIVPLSALSGDNVVRPSERTPWYQGPPLLTLLENLPVDAEREEVQARFFVQWVIRHNGSGPDAFRGYAGQLRGGAWRVGDAVQVLPSRESARIAGLLRGAQAVDQALPGDSITVVLDRDIDLSRGDVLVDAQARPALDRDFEADLCWLDQQALNPARLYWLKQGTRLTQVRVQAVRTRRDIHELRSVDWNGTLAMNDIGRVQLRARDPLVLDDYDDQRATGAFILIDTATNQTAAAGLVRR